MLDGAKAKRGEAEVLDTLMLQSEGYEGNFKTVMASLAFFYGQTSGGRGDVQSFATFLYRLVDHYKVLPASKVKSVFGLELNGYN